MFVNQGSNANREDAIHRGSGSIVGLGIFPLIATCATASDFKYAESRLNRVRTSTGLQQTQIARLNYVTKVVHFVGNHCSAFKEANAITQEVLNSLLH